MTTNDEWVRERATGIAMAARDIDNTGDFYFDTEKIAEMINRALHETIERGKAEQDKAVAAERERADAGWEAYRGAAEAAETKLARLENPDEALVEAVARQFTTAPRNRWDAAAPAKAILAALARTLTGQEGESNDD